MTEAIRKDEAVGNNAGGDIGRSEVPGGTDCAKTPFLTGLRGQLSTFLLAATALGSACGGAPTDVQDARNKPQPVDSSSYQYPAFNPWYITGPKENETPEERTARLNRISVMMVLDNNWTVDHRNIYETIYKYENAPLENMRESDLKGIQLTLQGLLRFYFDVKKNILTVSGQYPNITDKELAAQIEKFEQDTVIPAKTRIDILLARITAIF